MDGVDGRGELTRQFAGRDALTRQVESYMDRLFDQDCAVIHKFGCEGILQNEGAIYEYLKDPKVNQQASAMIVKFAPDYILLKTTEPKQIFFLDVKHSISPIWAKSRLKMLKDKNRDDSISVDRIGVVAREALLSYRRFYPNSIVLMVSPYNSKVVMAQFADRIRCLYCYRSPGHGDYDCNECPSSSGGFFDIERARDANGSQTPMTDVDLDSFMPIADFFAGLGIGVNEGILNDLKEEIKAEPISFTERCSEDRKNNILYKLAQAGCEWIDYSVYFTDENDFYHLDPNCYCLSDVDRGLLNYIPRHQIARTGKRKCKFCFRES